MLNSIKHFAKNYGGDLPPAAYLSPTSARLWLLVQFRFDSLPSAPVVSSDNSPQGRAKQARVDKLAAGTYRDRRLQSAQTEVVLVPAGCSVGQLKAHIADTLGAVYRMFRGLQVRQGRNGLA